MSKKRIKLLSWLLLLASVATLANGCIWWGPRHRRWHDGWRDDRGWHRGYYY